MNAAVQIDRAALAELCRRWKIRERSLFGSAPREDFRPDSDLDFLIGFEPRAGWDLFDGVDLRDELAALTLWRGGPARFRPDA